MKRLCGRTSHSCVYSSREQGALSFIGGGDSNSGGGRCYCCSVGRLIGPISRDTAILSLRYPISRDNFEGRLALPQNGAIPRRGT